MPDVEANKAQIKPLSQADWEEVGAIYLAGIKGGNATFETQLPTWEDWDSRHISDMRLVARLAGHVIGWAALSHTSSRLVYQGVAEDSIYIAGDHQRQGIGDLLLAALIAQSEQKGYWTLQTSIFPENLASLALHQKHGFRLIGCRQRIARLNGVWRDTLLLERRSPLF
jgi:phosphinothricin acetyltransferase